MILEHKGIGQGSARGDFRWVSPLEIRSNPLLRETSASGSLKQSGLLVRLQAGAGA